ncbi:50S ribosomal protein L11 methyltransferase [Pelagibacterium lentulum]|uniref:Uncharacterized protein n=1 Tax=Pelagibacterium lentulum TaxID=2029865 RepID=A0A916R5X2_9HYPH|nr:50S ribosomal protein L11 methyltransferase [Pelagibacterium lentulum]GGA36334.1 hypothetical protein GCM10011499_02100 [Pelagibacterium lentulum]
MIFKQANAVKNYLQDIPYIHEKIMEIRNKRYFTKPEIHERMLADESRVSAYYKAIKKYISPGDIAVDLGTGTGILAMFASKAGARKVYAIDHSDIIEMAEFLAKDNDIDNVVFFKGHSRSFAPQEKVTAIIHEQMGSELFNEYLIQNITDLRDRILAPGGKILPSKFELFLEPVSLKPSYKMPFLWERDLFGLKFSGTRRFIQESKDFSALARTTLQRRILPDEVEHLLCNPEPVFKFDLYQAGSDTFGCTWHQQRSIVQDGEIDGYCLYFKTLFDDEIFIQNGPNDRRTSWNCHFIRSEAIPVSKGDRIGVDWDVKDICNVSTWTHATTVLERAGSAS